MNYMDLSGTWTCEIPGQKKSIQLPGTLDESGIGFADDPHQQWKVDEVERIGFYHEGDPIVTRLTRKATFEGIARLEKTIDWKTRFPLCRARQGPAAACQRKTCISALSGNAGYTLSV